MRSETASSLFHRVPPPIAPNLAEWPFPPNRLVRIRPGSGSWRDDWTGVLLRVVGCSIDRTTKKILVHVSEDWPRDGGMSDLTPEDLETVPEPSDADT